MDFETLIAQKEIWTKMIGKRALSFSKTGGDVIIRWPDGFYVIQFSPTDEGIQSMQRDGNDLQNCLANGYYNRQVKDGTNVVMALRTPADEAVVGFRFHATAGSIGRNTEVKGKQNNVPVAKYRPYVIGLMNLLSSKYPEYKVFLMICKISTSVCTTVHSATSRT